MKKITAVDALVLLGVGKTIYHTRIKQGDECEFIPPPDTIDLRFNRCTYRIIDGKLFWDDREINFIPLMSADDTYEVEETI